jgi:catechol 2,3-dioxygenase-like lactoylglutathione lyase family enzyme
MIGYTTVGTNDLPRATKFYDELFGAIGIPRLMEYPRGLAWGTGWDKPGFGIITPFDGKPATIGNGCMVALVMDSKDKVNAVHAKALALGGTDEGAPGDRGDGFYAGYFRDLDGNKLNAFCMG